MKRKNAGRAVFGRGLFRSSALEVGRDGFVRQSYWFLLIGSSEGAATSHKHWRFERTLLFRLPHASARIFPLKCAVAVAPASGCNAGVRDLCCRVTRLISFTAGCPGYNPAREQALCISGDFRIYRRRLGWIV